MSEISNIVLRARHRKQRRGTEQRRGGRNGGGLSPQRRGVCKSAVYDHVMGLFRSAMSLFRGKAEKNREKAAAEPLKEQTRTVTAQAEVARREVKSEARPNPDIPGWGQTIGQEIGKAREDRASQE